SLSSRVRLWAAQSSGEPGPLTVGSSSGYLIIAPKNGPNRVMRIYATRYFDRVRSKNAKTSGRTRLTIPAWSAFTSSYWDMKPFCVSQAAAADGEAQHRDHHCLPRAVRRHERAAVASALETGSKNVSELASAALSRVARFRSVGIR